MILITGYKGFIGSHFLRTIEKQLNMPVKCIDKDDGWKFLAKFNEWDRVSMIIHNGAMSSTVEKNWMSIAHYNQDFTAHLFGRAIEYAMDFGLPKIQQRIFKMADKLREGMQEIPQLEATDQGRLKCGIVTFRHEAMDAATIKSELARRKINVSVSSGSGSRLSFMERGIESVVRASMHYYNSEEELEHFLSKIRQLVA